MRDEIKALQAYKEKSGLSYGKLGRDVGVHAMTIYNWFRGFQQPSDMALRIVREFLATLEAPDAEQN